MKKMFTRFTVPGLVLIALLLVCAGSAVAGVLHPALAALPLVGIGAVKVRDDLCMVRTIKYTHSSATTVDTIYYLNGHVLLAQNSALANAANIFVLAGLIEYTKVSTEVWTAGQKIYWDDTNTTFTNVRAVGCILAGYASEPAANPSATGLIVLDPAMKAASNPAASIIAAGLSAAENDADASVVITVAGVVATDVVTATVSAAAAAVYVTKAVCTANTITVTLSGNGGAGTVVNYQVSRAVI